MSKKDQTPRRIGRDQAFHDFCRMEPGYRNLVRLQEKYEADPDVKTPSMSTMRRWSADGHWRERAKEHDEAVTQRANEKQLETEADRLVSCAQEFRHLSHEMVTLLRARLGEVSIDKPADVATLVNAAIESAKTAEVMTGGVSDRTEALGASEGETTQDSVDKLTQALDKLRRGESSTGEDKTKATRKGANGHAVH